jgi:peptidyl-prolyl cis-trans isomerase D
LVNGQREEVFQVYIANLTKKYETKGAVRYSKKQPAPGASPFGS